MVFPILTEATYLNAASYTAAEERLADQAMFIREGIVRVWDSSLAVTIDGSDNITVQPGAVAIDGNPAAAGTGLYRSALPTTATNPLPTPRDASNPRIDIVGFRVLDPDVVPTHVASLGQIEVFAGTPSSTPSAPTMPSMCVELARITVPAVGGGAASVDSSYRKYACAPGGMVDVPTASRLPSVAGKYQRARALDTGVVYVWNGTQWLGADWTTLTVASPFAAVSGQTPQYKVTDGVLYLSGTVTRTSGFTAAYTTVATLPAIYAPPATRHASAMTNSGIHTGAQVAGGTGVVSIFQSAATTAYMSITALGSWPVI